MDIENLYKEGIKKAIKDNDFEKAEKYSKLYSNYLFQQTFIKTLHPNYKSEIFND